VIVVVAFLFLYRPTGGTFVGPQLASTVINREQGSLPARITIPSGASELRVRLLLPQGILPSADYRADLDNKNDFKPVSVVESDREGVWVVIPVSQLPRGEYSLRLVAITDSGEREIPGDYLFNIN
jgi:hypothetical protein